MIGDILQSYMGVSIKRRFMSSIDIFSNILEFFFVFQKKCLIV